MTYREKQALTKALHKIKLAAYAIKCAKCCGAKLPSLKMECPDCGAECSRKDGKCPECRKKDIKKAILEYYNK